MTTEEAATISGFSLGCVPSHPDLFSKNEPLLMFRLVGVPKQGDEGTQ